MKVTILRGVPGSGKSTMAMSLSGLIISADDYFMVNGEYRFEPSKLPVAHASCLRRFVWAIEKGQDVIVDNTNTTAVEVAPYAALALAFGFDLEIITVLADPAVAAARNVHGVPEAAVLAMHDRLMSAQFPPWWPHRTVAAGR